MSKLKSLTLTRTPGGNRYLFDRQKKSVLLCNRLLHHILHLFEKGIDIKEWLDSFQSDPVTIEGCGTYSREELEYYYRKFLFLQGSGYFSQPEEEEFVLEPITPAMVKYSLANSQQITFEVTDKCNLKCEYCGYGHFYGNYDSREGTELDIHAAKRLLNYLIKLWNSPLNTSHRKNFYISFYGGEPLLNMKFIKEIVGFLKGMKSLHNRFVFNMTTNALLLPQHMDYLAEHNFKLLISLDGNERNNGYRILKNGKPAFPLIIRGIEALKKKYPAYFKTNVSFNAVLHNLNSIPEVYRFIEGRYGKTPRVGEMNNTGVKTSKQKDFWKVYTSLEESFKSLPGDTGDTGEMKKDMLINIPDIKSLSAFLLKYSGFVYENYRHLLSLRPSKKLYPTGTCIPFNKKLFVTATGKILPCESISNQFYLGRVSKDRLTLSYPGIARKYNSYYAALAEQCSRCYRKEACGACIFTMKFVKGHPVCYQKTGHEQFSQYLAYHLAQFEAEPGLYKTITEVVSVDM